MLLRRLCRPLVVLGVVLFVAVAAGPAQAQFTSFSAPLTGGSAFATNFTTCFGVIGPVGVMFDSSSFYANDCHQKTYRFPLSGGSAPAQPLSQNGLYGGLAVQGGHYYGVHCCFFFVPLAEGLYEFDPSTLSITRTVTTSIGSPRAVVADPVSGDLYVSTCLGGWQIYRIQNPDSATPIITPFGDETGRSGCIDGMTMTSDGKTLWAADYGSPGGGTGNGAQTVVGFDTATGAQVAAVNLCCHGPDGMAVAAANTTIGTTDVSNNVFVNSNDGTIERIDTNNGNGVSVVASGGTRGDFATVGADGCMYVAQSSEVEKLSPCFFQRSVSLLTSKDQCKDGGWRSFGVFKNQGDCVSYVATRGKNLPG